MPRTSLELICITITTRFNHKRLNGIHIGNFVGVSLSYVVNSCRILNKQSLIVAIDPNIPHRGIERPSELCNSVLLRYGLQKNVLFVQGYSLEKSFSNDGVDFDNNYNPKDNYSKEFAAENQLEHLLTLSRNNYDFIIIDGNHNAKYLEKEIALAKELLSPEGLVILDDVDQNWPSIEDVFKNSNSLGFRQILNDGRIGIMEKLKV